MKRVLIPSVFLGILALATVASAQGMPGCGEMKVMRIKGEGREVECCKMVGHHRMGECGEGFYLHCADELGLSEEQMKRLKAIRSEHEKSTIKMGANLEIMELELRDLLQQETPDRAAIDRKITALGELKTKMRKDQVHAHLEARSVLTKEQLEKCGHSHGGSCGEGKERAKEGSCCKGGMKFDRQCK